MKGVEWRERESERGRWGVRNEVCVAGRGTRERICAREREWRRETEGKGGIERGVMAKEERERGKGVRGVRVYGCTDEGVCV